MPSWLKWVQIGIEIWKRLRAKRSAEDDSLGKKAVDEVLAMHWL